MIESSPAAILSLAGTWNISFLDQETTIQLPGTMDDAELGEPVEFPQVRPEEIIPKRDYLKCSRRFRFYGKAVYRRDFTIAREWANKRILLFLERCFWMSTVLINGRSVGSLDSLCTPHVYDIGILGEGKHRIEIQIDNRLRYDLGNEWADWSHSVSEQTQPNWNGVIGRIELIAREPRDVTDLQIFPDAAKRRVLVKAKFDDGPATELRWVIRDGSRIILDGEVRVQGDSGEWEMDLGVESRLWDEFHPKIYNLEVKLGDGLASTAFGLRNWGIHGTQLEINGRPILLRGTLENLVFPLTGHPPMDIDSWKKIIRLCKEWGLNHMRCHSWCPPEAAFAAADEEGFYFQAEGPTWIHDWGMQKERDEWVSDEMERIVRAYGNHPSLLILSVGNEQAGDMSVPEAIVRNLKQHDRRRAYAASTAWGPYRECDVDFLGGDIPWLGKKAIREKVTPSTEWDHREGTRGNPVPIITHELGQFASYPDFSVIEKFTGSMRPRCLELMRDHMASKGIAHLQPSFTHASGRLAAVLYKSEIEAARRTPGHAGFQILDLRDSLSQGIASIGMMDPLWNNKGFISANQWKEFSGATCILARFDKRIYRAGEPITVRFQISHFGCETLRDAVLEWRLQAADGAVVRSGSLPPQAVSSCALEELGSAQIETEGLAFPAKYVLSVALAGFTNQWDLWIYPPAISASVPDGVIVADHWSPELRRRLQDGATVFLQATATGMKWIQSAKFGTVFYSPVLLPTGQPLGFVCDPSHPAFAGFPTDDFMNWQWFDIMENACVADLDKMPGDFQPVLPFIDNYLENRRLGALLEARVGEGRILISTLDLTNDLACRPAASLLRRSLLDYLSQPSPCPLHSLTLPHLDYWLWWQP